MVQAPNLDEDQQALIDKLQFRIQAVLRAKQSRYILLNAPNDQIEAITAILPVLKSPTVLPLAQAGWSSIHSVINSGDFWEVIDQLKEAGAEDILVCPIEKWYDNETIHQSKLQRLGRLTRTTNSKLQRPRAFG